MFQSDDIDAPLALESEWQRAFVAVSKTIGGAPLVGDAVIAVVIDSAAAQTATLPAGGIAPTLEIVRGLLYGALTCAEVDSTAVAHTVVRLLPLLEIGAPELPETCIALQQLVWEHFDRVSVPARRRLYILLLQLGLRPQVGVALATLFARLFRHVACAGQLVTADSRALAACVVAVCSAQEAWVHTTELTRPALMACLRIVAALAPATAARPLRDDRARAFTPEPAGNSEHAGPITVRADADDHAREDVAALTADALAFCGRVFAHHRAVCVGVGRELVLAMHATACVPGAASFWRSVLGADAADTVQQMLCTRTSRQLIAVSLPPKIENYLMFLMTKVRKGHHFYHTKWFEAEFFDAPGHDRWIAHMLRFIISNHHPSNEVLASDILPRYDVILWLLHIPGVSLATSQSMKLALFLDWFAYQGTPADNIMHVEPAVLAMLHGLGSHSATTASLLEFLCLAPGIVFPQLEVVFCMRFAFVLRAVNREDSFQGFIASNISCALQDSVKKGVISSMQKITNSVALERNLVEMLSVTFPSLGLVARPLNYTLEDLKAGRNSPTENAEIRAFLKAQSLANELTHPAASAPPAGDGARAAADSGAASSAPSASVASLADTEPVVITGDLATVALHQELAFMTPSFHKLGGSDDVVTKAALSTILTQYCCMAASSARDSQVVFSLARRLCPVVTLLLSTANAPTPLNVSGALPLFLFAENTAQWGALPTAVSSRTATGLTPVAPPDDRILLLLHALNAAEPRVGHFFLLHLFMRHQSTRIGGDRAWAFSLPFLGTHAFLAYLAVAQPESADAVAAAHLEASMAVAPEHVPALVAFFFGQWPLLALGSTALLHAVAAACAGGGAGPLRALAHFVVLGETALFHANLPSVAGEHGPARPGALEPCLCPVAMFVDTLLWTAGEQRCVWHLLVAEGTRLRAQLPPFLGRLLPHINPSLHPEAALGLGQLCALCLPTAALVSVVMIHAVTPAWGQFAVACLQHWCQNGPLQLATVVTEALDLLATQATMLASLEQCFETLSAHAKFALRTEGFQSSRDFFQWPDLKTCVLRKMSSLNAPTASAWQQRYAPLLEALKPASITAIVSANFSTGAVGT